MKRKLIHKGLSLRELSTGFPGYDSIIPPDSATIGEILKENGYATSWFGKDHNTPTYQYSVAGPDQPFLVYYVPGGTHSPHQPTKEWIEKFKGKFDMGWEKLREEIFANQKRLGVIPADAQLTPWPDALPKWESLTFLQKKLCARQAEVFAAYAAYTDYEIGRVIQEVEDEGKLDNTLIIYICGDNGTSAEGTLSGTFNQMTAYNGILDVPEPLELLHFEDWGSDKTYPHMAVGWAWAFDTPFKWTKQIASHFGGTRQGLAISWPGHIKDVGGIRTQFHHVIDLVPTILEATGIRAPEVVNGIKQKPIEGVSIVPDRAVEIPSLPLG
jgi:arylsulfatase A-like enzyme